MNEKLVFLLINGILVALLIITLIREYLREKFRLSTHRFASRNDETQSNHSFDSMKGPHDHQETMNEKMTAETACKILGVHSMNDKQQVKKAYHELVKKYHPDHVSFLGTEFQQMAEDKTRKINLAYTVIIRQLEGNRKSASGNSTLYR